MAVKGLSRRDLNPGHVNDVRPRFSRLFFSRAESTPELRQFYDSHYGFERLGQETSARTFPPYTSPATPEEAVAVYAGAVAHFKRYDVGHPVRDLWEESHTDGLAYWTGKSAEVAGLEHVARSADEAFRDAIRDGVSIESLAQGLGRAMARFKLDMFIRPVVAPSVSNAIKGRLGIKGVVRLPLNGADQNYYAACRAEVLNGAIRQLGMDHLEFPPPTNWNTPSALFPKTLSSETGDHVWLPDRHNATPKGYMRDWQTGMSMTWHDHWQTPARLTAGTRVGDLPLCYRATFSEPERAQLPRIAQRKGPDTVGSRFRDVRKVGPARVTTFEADAW